MLLRDIADITKMIIGIIDARIKTEPGAPPAVVLPVPLDKMSNEDGLSFFLYHIQENAHYKNMPFAGKDQPPVRFTPMGLNLYYQLCPHHTADTPDATYNDQFLMGIAMKALHDFPEINDDTTIKKDGNLVKVMESGLIGKGNRFKISLLPVTYNESVQYWAAGDSPLRMAAYYEVGVVFLEPETFQSYTGRVLQYGAFVFPGGAPSLTGSRNTLEFLSADLSQQQVVAQPAQVKFGQKFDLLGSGFSGDDLEIMFSGPGGKRYKATGWPLELKSNGLITVTVQEQAEEIKENEVSVPNTALTPGLYAAQINVIQRRKLPNGEIRTFNQISNQFPFSIIPRIDSISGPLGGIVTVTGYRFSLSIAEKDVLENEILIYVGEKRIFRSVESTPGAGEFKATDDFTLSINLPPSLPSGKLPLRVIVAGAESPPNWITIS